MTEAELRQELGESRQTLEQLRAQIGGTAEETTILVACLNEAMRTLNKSLTPVALDDVSQPVRQYISDLQREIGSLRKRNQNLANVEDVTLLRENIGNLTKQVAEKDHQLEMLNQKLQSTKKRGCL